MLTRKQEHVFIMTVIYDELNDFVYGNSNNPRDASELILETAKEISGEEEQDISAFVKDTVFISLQKYPEIVNAFLPYLKNWKWDRIPSLSRAILIMSYTHFYYTEKVDKKVVIDIAVDLAKKYVEEKQAKFINAILDGVLK